MRIIAGSARGRLIQAPRGQDTRPTQDYVRESLFNILQREVPEARVLDLFAGSGALALEALSRDAEQATLVDHAGEAITCIQRNLELLGFAQRATVIRAEWDVALARLASAGKTFTLVFLDPPYAMEDTGAQCNRLADLGLLSQGACVVVEHRREHTPTPDTRFALRSARRYGDTMIHFFEYPGGEASHA